jgi:rSAM/selenodomain-associated transferase 1
MNQPALMIFAKQPIPGQAKTRLRPEYTAEQAAEIAASLVQDTVELAVANWPGAIYLCGAPHADHPLFHALRDRYRVTLMAQSSGDLGARMQHALAYGIERHGAAAILGCDVPHCDWDILDDANTALARGENVIGPTEDGGYYFIGLVAPHADLFAGIAWGGPCVYSVTCERAKALGIEFTLLPTLHDIDTAADLWLIAQQYAPLRRWLKCNGR